MTNDPDPVIVIATILNEHGPTGVQTHFHAFRRYLDENGRPSVLVTPFDAPKWLVYPVFGIRKVIDPVSGPGSVWWYRFWHAIFLRTALRTALSQTPNCVVYAQCPLSARAALKARQTSEQQVIMAVHFNGSQADEWFEKGKIGRNGIVARAIRTLESTVLPLLDGIVYVSRFMKRELESRIPRLEELSSAVIPNFCRPATEAAEKFERVDIINVGTLEPRKNQQFLLELLAYAKHRGRRYTLALVGDGPDRVKLERHARTLGIERQVRFVGHRPGAIQMMASARIYAHSAFLENMPLALIEAMASSLPILAPDVGGIPDIFQDGEGGYFWKLDDVPASGEILIRTLDNAAELKRLAAAAKARFDRHFEASHVACRLYAFIVRRAGATSTIKLADVSAV
jgi:glycosyltransferase involved in cell wall biosynthesis